MIIKEFIKQSLIQIIEGIDEANKTLNTNDVYIGYPKEIILEFDSSENMSVKVKDLTILNVRDINEGKRDIDVILTANGFSIAS